MKEIDLYIRGSAYPVGEKIEGQYICILNYKGVNKELYKQVDKGEITSSKMMVRGLIDSLKILKEPCKIHLYVHTHVGFGKMKNKKGDYRENISSSVNKDLLLILKEELVRSEHEIVEIVGKEKQRELRNKLLKYRSKTSCYFC